MVPAVHEAATDAVGHGRGATSVGAWTDRATLVVEVCDTAGPARHGGAGSTPPDPDRPRGRGRWMMRCPTDGPDVVPGRSGTTVRMRTRC